MTVHYISSYANASLIENYMTTPSARAKVEYIKDTLKEVGANLCLFSSIRCRSNTFKICKRKEIRIDANEVQLYPFSIGGNGLIFKVISYVLICAQMIWYLFAKVKANDTILLYHSFPETRIVRFLKPIMKAKVILEVEEIYNACYKKSKRIEKEKQIVSSFADSYILVNTIIGKKCNISKPSVVCEGQYRMLSSEKKPLRDNNNVVNLIYAGVLKKNADVFLALDAARLLDSSFCLHIAGYGDSETVDLIHKEMEEISSYPNKCKIIFHGCLFGEEYETLLSNCSLGLCTRLLEDGLSDYTFPSKVFAYLTRNLRVICTPISCVMNSSIANNVVFSKLNSPESIVSAIKLAIYGDVIDNKSLVDIEHQRFKREIAEYIN